MIPGIPIPYAILEEADGGVRYVYITREGVRIDPQRTDRPQLDLAVELLVWRTRALNAERALDQQEPRP